MGQIHWSKTVFRDLGSLPFQHTKPVSGLLTMESTQQANTAWQSLLASAFLIWGSWRLGDKLFEHHTLASLQNTSPPRDMDREEWGRCCFPPLNFHLITQTAHLWLLTIETRKEWNLDNSFVFKVKHTHPQNFGMRRFTTVLCTTAKD